MQVYHLQQGKTIFFSRNYNSLKKIGGISNQNAGSKSCKGYSRHIHTPLKSLSHYSHHSLTTPITLIILSPNLYHPFTKTPLKNSPFSLPSSLNPDLPLIIYLIANSPILLQIIHSHSLPLPSISFIHILSTPYLPSKTSQFNLLTLSYSPLIHISTFPTTIISSPSSKLIKNFQKPIDIPSPPC